MMMNDSQISSLLLAIVREDWAEAERRSATPVDPERFVERCRLSDIHPWVHHLLERESRQEMLGGEIFARLGAMRGKLRRDNLLLLGLAEQALDRLNRAGITPIALKGLDLLTRVYDRFDQRTIDDVDLLVRREELRETIDILGESGWILPGEPEATHYIRSSHHLPMTGPGPIHVGFEVHWNLAQEARYRIDPAALFERAVPLEISGRKALRLEDHDFVAHLLIHHLSHYFDRRLKWLVDLRQIVSLPGFRWTEVAGRIEAWGGTAAAGSSLVHLRKLAPEWIPADALRAMPMSAWRRWVTWPLRSSHPLELFRGTERRRIQLFLAAVMLERPTELPRWLWHRARRDAQAGENPLDLDD